MMSLLSTKKTGSKTETLGILQWTKECFLPNFLKITPPSRQKKSSRKWDICKSHNHVYRHYSWTYKNGLVPSEIKICTDHINSDLYTVSPTFTLEHTYTCLHVYICVHIYRYTFLWVHWFRGRNAVGLLNLLDLYMKVMDFLETQINIIE